MAGYSVEGELGSYLREKASLIEQTLGPNTAITPETIWHRLREMERQGIEIPFEMQDIALALRQEWARELWPGIIMPDY